MRIEDIPISQIKPNRRNARIHSAEQIRQIADSIVTFDFTTPLLVSEDGELIAGHGRYEAAKLLGLEKVPVIVVTGLSAARRRALGIADNQIAANATWDRKSLALEIPELTDLLSMEGLDISILGFDEIEIDQIINIDCETKAADPPGDIDSKWFQPCTIWLLGKHKLLCGEARSTADIQATIRRWQIFTRKNAVHAESGRSFNEISAEQNQARSRMRQGKS